MLSHKKIMKKQSNISQKLLNVTQLITFSILTDQVPMHHLNNMNKHFKMLKNVLKLNQIGPKDM
jgi:hypothetical protein